MRHFEPAQAELLASAVVSACAGDGWADPFQPRLLRAVFGHVLNYAVDIEDARPVSIGEVAAAIPSVELRAELVELMVTMAILCSPIPVEVSESVCAWAAELGVGGAGVLVAHELALGHEARATKVFIRNTYTDTANSRNPEFPRLLETYGDKAINFTVEPDLELAERYQALSTCAPGTLGRALWQFYTDRGFAFPGVVGGANRSLAHHDWGHVIYDYGTTGIGEVEAAAFRAASSDFRGVVMQFLGDLMFYHSSLLTSLVSGKHPRGEMDVPDAACRVADAVRRGRACTLDPYDPDLDFFNHIDDPVEELRAKWNVLPKTIGEDCPCLTDCRATDS